MITSGFLSALAVARVKTGRYHVKFSSRFLRDGLPVFQQLIPYYVSIEIKERIE
jgi:hypothetical protein